MGSVDTTTDYGLEGLRTGVQFRAEQKKKRPLGRPRCRLEDNIKMDLTEDGVDMIKLARDREQWRVLVYMIKNPRVS
jgi:hypothetical protein